MTHARCFSRWTGAVFACAMAAHPSAHAQVIERELGDFSLKLGTTPSRTMAQGLVTPGNADSTFHGGLDLTHDSGFYFGQWSPSTGLSPDTSLEVDYNPTTLFMKPWNKTDRYNVVYTKVPKCASSTTAGAIRTIGYNHNITSDQEFPKPYTNPKSLLKRLRNYKSTTERLKFWRETMPQPFLLAMHEGSLEYFYLADVRECVTLVCVNNRQ